MSANYVCIQNPFNNIAIYASVRGKEQLIKISTDYGLRNSFKIPPLISFLVGLRNQFPALPVKAVAVTKTKLKKLNSVACSPQAKYTDRAAAAC
jgi:hypothetical protein